MSVESDGAHGAGVIGVGCDVVAVDRVAHAIERRPKLVERLLSTSEHEHLASQRAQGARTRSIAARLAAKEAIMKSLGVGIGAVSFREIEVTGGRGVPPEVVLHGRALARAELLMVDRVQISMSHDAGVAMATAVATRSCRCNPS